MIGSSATRSVDAGGVPAQEDAQQELSATAARSFTTSRTRIVVNGLEMTAEHFGDLKDLFPNWGVVYDGLGFEALAREMGHTVGRPFPPVTGVSRGDGVTTQDGAPPSPPIAAAASPHHDKTDDQTRTPTSPLVVVDGIEMTPLHFEDLKKHYGTNIRGPSLRPWARALTFKEFARQLSLAVESRKHGRPYPFFVRNLFQANGEPLPFGVEIRSARDLLIVNLKEKLARGLESAPLLLKIINQEVDPHADDVDVEGTLLDPAGEYWVTDRKSAPFEDGEWKDFTDDGLSTRAGGGGRLLTRDVVEARKVRAKEFARFLTTENAPGGENFIHTLLLDDRSWSQLLRYIMELASDETLFTYSVELPPRRFLHIDIRRTGILCDIIFNCSWWDSDDEAGTLVRTMINRFPSSLPVVFGSRDGTADRVLNAMLDDNDIGSDGSDPDGGDGWLWNWTITTLGAIFNPQNCLDRAHIPEGLVNYVNPTGTGSITFVYRLAEFISRSNYRILAGPNPNAFTSVVNVFKWIVQDPCTTLATLTNRSPLGLLDSAIARAREEDVKGDLYRYHHGAPCLWLADLKASRDVLAAAISARQAGPPADGAGSVARLLDRLVPDRV